jgi:subtilisin family serine protease
VVAAAGNEAEAGMVWPAAFPEVISVGASGWTMEWQPVVDAKPNRTWWYALDVTEDETEVVEQSYITWWSSRPNQVLVDELRVEYDWPDLPYQELDLVAPGSWVLGPYMPYGIAHPPVRPVPWVPGEYYFLAGTSMSTPHVSGIAALMLSINPSLTQADVESILKETALYIPPGQAEVFYPYPEWGYRTFSWGADATGEGLVQADAAIAYIKTSP